MFTHQIIVFKQGLGIEQNPSPPPNRKFMAQHFLNYLNVGIDVLMQHYRDCPPEHSTFPFDMESEILPSGSPVPLNDTGRHETVVVYIYRLSIGIVERIFKKAAKQFKVGQPCQNIFFLQSSRQAKRATVDEGLGPADTLSVRIPAQRQGLWEVQKCPGSREVGFTVPKQKWDGFVKMTNVHAPKNCNLHPVACLLNCLCTQLRTHLTTCAPKWLNKAPTCAHKKFGYFHTKKVHKCRIPSSDGKKIGSPIW